MLVGHIGVGLAAKSIEPRLKLGTLVCAALFLDIVFWVLVLAGVETVGIPRDASVYHYLTFHFPWSHSLLAAAVWSVVFAVAWAVWGSRRARRLGAFWDASALVALVVFSHWLLDALVHVPDLPLAPGVGAVGLGLWKYQPAALILEFAIAFVALLALVLRTPLHWSRKAGVAVMTVLFAALTALGAYGDTQPPSPHIIALSSLALMFAAIAVCAWCDRGR